MKPFDFGSGGLLYQDARLARDELASGLADRGLTTLHPPEGPQEPAEAAVPPRPTPRGKKRRRPPPLAVQQKVPPPPKTKAQKQEAVSTALELVGIASVTVGVAWFSLGAALIVLGICLAVLGFALRTTP